MRAVEGSLGHSLQYRGEEWREKKEREAWQFPVLAQRAVADSPRWTRAHRETARPLTNTGWGRERCQEPFRGAWRAFL